MDKQRMADWLKRYRVVGPIVTYLVVTFVGGFVIGFTGGVDVGPAIALGQIVAGAWILFGAGHELLSAAGRVRA